MSQPIIVGTAGGDGATVTIPAGHIPGDVLIVFAFRDGNTTNPSIPSGWTNDTNTIDGTSCSATIGWKVATSTSETSGTWTNADSCVVAVLRNADNIDPIKGRNSVAGTTNTVVYPAITAGQLLGASGFKIFAFCGHRSTDVTIETAPSGMTNILKFEGAAADMAIHEAASDDAWAQTNASITGTASGVLTAVLAIRGTRHLIRNDGVRQVRAGVSNTAIISVGSLG